jgi:putative acetyltransferase
MEVLSNNVKKSKVIIADYSDDMLDEMMELFYNTVQTVGAKHYTQEQLDRWAPDKPDITAWKQRLNNNICKVALINNEIVGFSELTKGGHVDTMYVHRDYQRRNIAGTLLKELMHIANKRNYKVLTTEASITAKLFFEKHGFQVTQVKKKLYNGKEFTNYKMIKEF